MKAYHRAVAATVRQCHMIADRFSGFNVKPDKGLVLHDIRVVRVERMKAAEKFMPNRQIIEEPLKDKYLSAYFPFTISLFPFD